MHQRNYGAWKTRTPFNTRLAEAMERAGFESLQTLSMLCGYNTPAVNKVVYANKPPSMDMAKRLADVLEVDWEWLREGKQK